jgi:peptidoglycan/LPS O-acetylase OafA/YrhL
MKKKLQFLQTLRAFAALLVVYHHSRGLLAGVLGLQPENLPFSREGSIGVQIFFIISGFIMVITTKNLPSTNHYLSNSYHFLIKRFFRIFPLYFILTFVWTVTSGKILQFFSNYLYLDFLKSIFFIPYSQFPILLVGWTLNFEMFFYLMFGLSLLNLKLRYYILLIFYFIILIFRNFSFEDFVLKMITDSILDYFVVGILFGLIYPKLKINAMLFNILLFVSVFVFVLYLFDVFVFDNHYLSVIIISFFTISVILLDTYKTTHKPWPFLVYLGDISYSLYLVHLFFIILAGRVLLKFPILQKVDFLIYILLFPTIFFATKFIHNTVEKKLSDRLTNFFLNLKTAKT